MLKNTTQNIFSISALLLLVAAIESCSSGQYVITLSEQQIQGKLNEAFPIEKDYLLVFKVVLQHPKVHLQEGSDRIDFWVMATTNVSISERQFEGKGQISGEVRYNPQKGELYLDNSLIEQLHIEGLPEKYALALKLAASLGLRQFLNRRPIYTLKPETFKQTVAKLVVKKIVVDNGMLKITLGLLNM